MSLSDTLTKYREALVASQDRQQAIYDSRSDKVGDFYNSFLNQLVRKYENKVGDKDWEKNVLDNFKNFFGTDNPTFVAVDGTSDKIQLEEYAVFFAASYGVKGTFSLDGKNSVEYERRDIHDELSMVAYVPIPFAELEDVDFSQIDDDNRFSMIDIHNRLMILAEIYLLYNEIKSENHPNILLWDQTFSGMFHWRAPPIKDVPMIINAYEHNGRKLTIADALISRSHPYNADLNTPAPSKGFFNMPNRILYELFNSHTREAKISELATLFGESEAELRRVIERFIQNLRVGDEITSTNCLEYEKSSDAIRLNPRYWDSWDFVVGLVESLCTKIFSEKDAKALTYSGKWVTTVDIDFMVSILLRKIIEISWEQNVLLIGVVKDSASKYFIRNYLGVMKKESHYSDYEILDLYGLLWSDRLTMEHLPIEDESLNAPWATVEYDSIFQILYLSTKTETQEAYIRTVPTSERIFARHLSLLFSTRQKGKVIFNHMLFVDRALLPKFDLGKINNYSIPANANEVKVTVDPFVDLNSSEPNAVQDFVTLFLHNITSNRFPDVIGYPEPLHKADLGAKTFNRMVQPMIRSSTMMYGRSSKPWSKSIRAKRKFK